MVNVLFCVCITKNVKKKKANWHFKQPVLRGKFRVINAYVIKKKKKDLKSVTNFNLTEIEKHKTKSKTSIGKGIIKIRDKWSRI